MMPGWWREELTSYGWSVVVRKLGLGPESSREVILSVVRGLQHRAGLPVTGRVDRRTAALLGEAAEWQSPPSWWREGMTLDEVDVPLDEVLRMQGRLGIKPLGVLDATTAWHLVVEYGEDVRVRVHRSDVTVR